MAENMMKLIQERNFLRLKVLQLEQENESLRDQVTSINNFMIPGEMIIDAEEMGE